MYKRLLKTLTVAGVIAIAIPVASATARPYGPGVGGYVQPTQSSQPSQPVISEKVAGLNVGVPTNPERRALMIRSEALNKQYHPGNYARPVVSEKTDGFEIPSQPTTTVVASTGSDFDWSDAGIGAAAISAAILAVVGGALVLRNRHHGRLAH